MRKDILTSWACLILGALFIITGLLIPFRIHDLVVTESFTVAPFKYIIWSFELSPGWGFDVYFTVRGGNDDINFYIEDPYGNTIYNAGRVSGRHSYSFTAQTTGVYSLYFDNSFSFITSKLVFVTSKPTLEIAGSITSANIDKVLIAIGLISVAVGIFMRARIPRKVDGKPTIRKAE